MQIVRTEPTTGNPATRTRREEIVPVFAESDEVEPDQAIDASTSETWEVAEGSTITRWAVQMDAVKQFVIAAAALDSQAEEEQAGGDDSHGGIYSAFFNHELVKVGAGDDDGDLNESNFDRKVGAIRVRDERGLVPLPYGGTQVVPTLRYLDKHYLAEFMKDEDTGQVVPVAQRPKRARVIWGDGEFKDLGDLLAYLQEDHSDLWPDQQWFIAVVGYGADHDAALAQFHSIAEKHPNVHVYSFSEVANAAEIAEDMAIAVLAKKA